MEILLYSFSAYLSGIPQGRHARSSVELETKRGTTETLFLIETGHGHMNEAICATHVQTVPYRAYQSLGTWKASETTKAAFTVKLKKSVNREREG